jgi:hypothetical protein
MSKIYIQLATYPPKKYHTIPAHPSQQNFKKKQEKKCPLPESNERSTTSQFSEFASPTEDNIPYHSM